MTTGAFDTLAAARDLEAAEFSREQAEAIARTIRSGQGDLATKADVAAVRSDVAALKWIVGIQSAICLATFAAVLFIAARL